MKYGIESPNKSGEGTVSNDVRTGKKLGGVLSKNVNVGITSPNKGNYSPRQKGNHSPRTKELITYATGSYSINYKPIKKES
jgi:hypothetical protein